MKKTLIQWLGIYLFRGFPCETKVVNDERLNC